MPETSPFHARYRPSKVLKTQGDRQMGRDSDKTNARVRMGGGGWRVPLKAAADAPVSPKAMEKYGDLMKPKGGSQGKRYSPKVIEKGVRP